MNYLTLDIGGSAIKYGLINDDIEFLEKGNIPAPKENIEQFIQTIVSLYKKYEGKISGIGISMPGVVNPDTGFAKTGGVFNYIKDINIVDLLQKHIPLPICIGNDAKCAANAEIGFGCLKDIDDAAVIILGTGIGGCLVIDGKVHIGKSFASGEFSGIRTKGRCDEVIEDEWSQVNGIEGLLFAVQKALNTTDTFTGKQIFEMANNNNQKVLCGLDDFCNQLACQIINLQFIFDPQIVAIGGGISTQPLLLEYTQKHIDRVYENYKNNNYPLLRPNVVICQHGNDANLIGAYFQLKGINK